MQLLYGNMNLVVDDGYPTVRLYLSIWNVHMPKNSPGFSLVMLIPPSISSTSMSGRWHSVRRTLIFPSSTFAGSSTNHHRQLVKVPSGSGLEQPAQTGTATIWKCSVWSKKRGRRWDRDLVFCSILPQYYNEKESRKIPDEFMVAAGILYRQLQAASNSECMQILFWVESWG